MTSRGAQGAASGPGARHGVASLRAVLGGGLIVIGAGEAAARLLTLGMMMWLSRRFDVVSYAALETTLAAVMFGMLAIEMGFAVVGIREIARDRDAGARLVPKVIAVECALAVAVAALFVALAAALPIDPPLPVLLAGFGASLLGVPFLLHWVFQGLDRPVAYAVPRVLRSGVLLVGAVLLVRGPEDVPWLCAAEAASVAVTAACCVALHVFAGGSVKPDWSGLRDRTLVRESVPVGLSNLLWALRTYLAVPVIAATGDAGETGGLAAALRIVMIYNAALDVYFTRLFPRVSLAAQSSPADLRTLLVRSAWLVTLPAAAVAAGVTWGAPAVVSTVFGDGVRPEDATAVLALLAWLAPVLAIRRHVRTGLITAGLQRADLVSSVAGVALLVALLAAFVPSAGAAGAAWAMLVSEAVSTVFAAVLLAPAIRTPAAGARP